MHCGMLSPCGENAEGTWGCAGGGAQGSTSSWVFKERKSIRRASLVAQTVKSLPVMQDTQVRSLGWEDALEKGVATHSSVLAWKTPWTEEPGGLQSMGSQRVRHD